MALIPVIHLEEKDHQDMTPMIHLEEKDPDMTPMILMEEKGQMTAVKDPLILMDANEAMIAKEVAKVLVVCPALTTMLWAPLVKITKTVDNGKEVVEAMEVVASVLQ